MAYGLRPHFGSSRSAVRAMYRECFAALGCLYGALYDDTEAEAIRDACEASGLPMGYGRMTRAPEVMGDEPPVLFRLGISTTSRDRLRQARRQKT